MFEFRSPRTVRLATLATVLAASLATASAPLTAQTAPLKVAVVDLEFVVANSPGGKALQQRLEKFQQEVQAQGEAMAAKGAELRKQVADGAGKLTPEQLTELNRQMEDQANAIRRFRDDKQKEGQKLQADGLREIEGQLMPILEKFRDESGYDLILNNVPGLVVLFNDKLNISQALLARLSAGK